MIRLDQEDTVAFHHRPMMVASKPSHDVFLWPASDLDPFLLCLALHQCARFSADTEWNMELRLSAGWVGATHDKK